MPRPITAAMYIGLEEKRLLMDKTASLSSLLDVSKIDVDMVSCVR